MNALSIKVFHFEKWPDLHVSLHDFLSSLTQSVSARTHKIDQTNHCTPVTACVHLNSFTLYLYVFRWLLPSSSEVMRLDRLVSWRCVPPVKFWLRWTALSPCINKSHHTRQSNFWGRRRLEIHKVKTITSKICMCLLRKKNANSRMSHHSEGLAWAHFFFIPVVCISFDYADHRPCFCCRLHLTPLPSWSSDNANWFFPPTAPADELAWGELWC